MSAPKKKIIHPKDSYNFEDKAINRHHDEWTHFIRKEADIEGVLRKFPATDTENVANAIRDLLTGENDE